MNSWATQLLSLSAALMVRSVSRVSSLAAGTSATTAVLGGAGAGAAGAGVRRRGGGASGQGQASPCCEVSIPQT